MVTSQLAIPRANSRVQASCEVRLLVQADRLTSIGRTGDAGHRIIYPVCGYRFHFRFSADSRSISDVAVLPISADCVAKLQKWLAAFFQRKEQPGDNRRSMCPQARYQSCRWVHHLLLWSPARLFDRRAHSPENLSPVIQKEFCNTICQQATLRPNERGRQLRRPLW